MRRIPIWLPVLLAALLPYISSLGSGFVFDDHEVVERHPAVVRNDPRLAWSSPYWPDRPAAGLYRPWTTTSYWLDQRLHGLEPWAFHGTNVLLHVAASLAALLLLRRLFPGSGNAPAWTAILFAVHPIHSEAVIGVVGRAELWAAAGMLIAYERGLAFARGRGSGTLITSAACAGLALFSKESAAGLLLLPAFHACGPWPGPGVTRRARWWRVAVAWAVPLLVLLLARVRVLGDLQGLDPPGLMDNALSRAPAHVRIAAALGLQWLSVVKILAPFHLSADYSYPSLLPGAAWQAAGVAFLLVVALSLYIVVRRLDAPILWGAAFAGAAGLLTSNILFPIGTIFAERLSYLPSLGALWVLVSFVRRLPLPRGSTWIACAWLLALTARTILRVPDWKDDATLFAATVRDAPRSGKAHANLAVTRLRGGQIQDAEREARTALALAPEYAPAEGALGSALLRQGRAPEALPHLEAAAHAKPRSSRNLEAMVELGNAYLTLRRGTAAESAFVFVRDLAPPGDTRHLIGMAGALATQSRWPESARAWQNAVLATPGDAAVERQWAFALWQAGSRDSAEQVYRALIARNPADPDPQNELAWMLAKEGRRLDEALGLARRAFELRPDPDTGDTVLETLAALGRWDEAEGWIRALRLLPEQHALADTLDANWRRRAARKDGP